MRKEENGNYKGPYTSRGKHFAKSTHHQDMWIITMVGTKKFYTMTASVQWMLEQNPPDPVKPKEEDWKKMSVADKKAFLAAMDKAKSFQQFDLSKLHPKKFNNKRKLGLADIKS